jgi:hypothetical protein
MKKLFALTLAVAFSCFSAWPVSAQDQPAAQTPPAEELEKQKAEREKNAYRLLEQVIDEAQSLRLTENRVRVQINGADMLWSQNQGRARSLFSMAAEGVAELGRAQVAAAERRGARPEPQNFRSFQLRQELVMAAARHDAALAYQLLAATKPVTPTTPVADQRGPRAQLTSEENLEQALLARIASLDPKLAAQNAEQMMDKGQFPRSLSEVINQLYRQDEGAAQKLAEKTVKRLQSANLLTNNGAGALVQTLLAPGPRPPASNTDDASKQRPANFGRSPSLEQALYLDLLTSAVDAALKAQLPAQTNQRGRPANQRGVVTTIQGSPRQVSGPQPPTEAQREQVNARTLLAGLMMSLPLIDQHLPAKAPALRQKMTEMGMLNNPTQNFAQTMNSIQGNPTVDTLVQAAATAPQQMQSRLYQQAAFKALEEGDTERARQIANDHLQNNARDVVMQRIDFREMTKKADGARFDEIRQSVARLQTDNEKIDLLVQLARDTKDNPKLAIQLLDEARQITNRRATRYDHFEQQLKVANAFAAVDAARSFEVLEPGINQLNELLAAAAVLSGFEVSMFRDGEMSLQGGNGLTNMVNRYGQALALLARSDFERSETLASRFQFTESRIMARLAIVQGLLGVSRQGGQRIVFNGNIEGGFRPNQPQQ